MHIYMCVYINIYICCFCSVSLSLSVSPLHSSATLTDLAAALLAAGQILRAGVVEQLDDRIPFGLVSGRIFLGLETVATGPQSPNVEYQWYLSFGIAIMAWYIYIPHICILGPLKIVDCSSSEAIRVLRLGSLEYRYGSCLLKGGSLSHRKVRSLKSARFILAVYCG